jgi:GTP-binding protein LepA
MKKTSDALIGDTFVEHNDKVTIALPGFKHPKPMVFAGVYPEDSSSFG